jgi:Rho termination factor, N-terminal domain
MDRITPRELVRPSIVDDRSAFDLQALAFLVAAVLTGVFVILFLLAFLPWLLSGALTAAVESLMRQLGFAKFTVDSIGDWVLVFVVGALAVAILVAAVTAVAAVANLLSYHLTSRRDRGPAAPSRSQLPPRDRGANGAAEGPLRETMPYEERTVDELYAEARYRGIPGRSQMKKAQLIQALRRQ